MHIPNGQVSPGLSFFRALEGLARPQEPGQAAQSRAAAKPVDGGQVTTRSQTDPAQAARPADPSEGAARAAADGSSYPRGLFLDIVV